MSTVVNFSKWLFGSLTGWLKAIMIDFAALILLLFFALVALKLETVQKIK